MRRVAAHTHTHTHTHHTQTDIHKHHTHTQTPQHTHTRTQTTQHTHTHTHRLTHTHTTQHTAHNTNTQIHTHTHTHTDIPTKPRGSGETGSALFGQSCERCLECLINILISFDEGLHLSRGAGSDAGPGSMDTIYTAGDFSMLGAAGSHARIKHDFLDSNAPIDDLICLSLCLSIASEENIYFASPQVSVAKSG